MTIKEYRDAVRQFDPNHARAYYALGVAAEAGEVAQAVQKCTWLSKNSSEFRRDEVCEEVGDLMWYLLGLLASYGLDLENQVLPANVDKLRARYPNGYDRHTHDNH